MLKVIDSLVVAHTDIRSDDEMLLTFQCFDVQSSAPLTWRTGDFNCSLLEVGLNSKSGAISNVQLVTPGSIRRAESADKKESMPCSSGVPVCDLSTWPELMPYYARWYHDEKNEIVVSVGDDFLTIHCDRQRQPEKLFCAGNAKFGVDAENNLVWLGFFGLTQADMQRIRKRGVR